MKPNSPLIKLTVALLLASTSVLATAGGGRVMIASGKPHLERGNQQLEAVQSTQIMPGDTVVAPIDSAIQWWMDDDSMLSAVAPSRIVIERHDASQSAADYRIIDGGVRIVSGLIKPTVIAPQAKVVAIGTDFSTYNCTGAICGMRKGLYVRVTNGVVRVTNGAGSLDAKAGQTIFVASASVGPILVASAPSGVLEMFAQMEFDPSTFDLTTDLSVHPVLRLQGGVSISPTPTPGPTATPTPTVGPTPTGGPTPTPSGGPTPTPSTGPTATPVPTPTGSPQPTPTSEPPGSPS